MAVSCQTTGRLRRCPGIARRCRLPALPGHRMPPPPPPPDGPLPCCGVQMSGKCLLSQGGWIPCPKGGSLCTCGSKPFCTSAKAYFGIEACKMFCGCDAEKTMKIKTCATPKSECQEAGPQATLGRASPVLPRPVELWTCQGRCRVHHLCALAGVQCSSPCAATRLHSGGRHAHKAHLPALPLPCTCRRLQEEERLQEGGRVQVRGGGEVLRR